MLSEPVDEPDRAADDVGNNYGRIPGPSCRALRQAITALYCLDDFFMERLGSGFFSDVYKVRHKGTGRVMVLKMNISLSNRPNVLREVQLMNRLKHPNILRFRGVCVHAGCLHALTEYMNGGSLEEWIQDSSKSLVWSLRIKLALDTARGLSYLHSKTVFHRDLTSKNILVKVVNQSPTAVVGDFGLADKIPDPLKRNLVRLPTVGSPWYMAPETLTGKWYDERADIFSFGIILCELIARIASDPDVLPRTQNFGVDYVAFSEMTQDCPPDFLQLTFKCCLVEPKSRPPFRELEKSLREILRKQRDRNELVQAGIQPHKFLDDVQMLRPTRRKSTSSIQPRNSRRSTSLAYVDLVDVNAAQNRCVGEHMSRADPHYVPSTVNPFSQATLLSEEYRDGNKKIVGYSSSLSPTVFEAPLVVRPTTEKLNLGVPIPAFKNSHSCPASPNAVRKIPLGQIQRSSGPTTCYESSSWHHCVPVVPLQPGDLDDLSNSDDDQDVTPRNSNLPNNKQRGQSPDSELAYYSLSDQSSCESLTPKSSSRCSDDSDGLQVSPLILDSLPHEPLATVVLHVPLPVPPPPLIRVVSAPSESMLRDKELTCAALIYPKSMLALSSS